MDVDANFDAYGTGSTARLSKAAVRLTRDMQTGVLSEVTDAQKRVLLDHIETVLGICTERSLPSWYPAPNPLVPSPDPYEERRANARGRSVAFFTLLVIACLIVVSDAVVGGLGSAIIALFCQAFGFVFGCMVCLHCYERVEERL